MPTAYFDTDVFHHFGEAFAERELAADLRDKTALSPITFIEVLSHLTIDNAEILAHIHAVPNWVISASAVLLPWPDVAIAHFGFGIEKKADGLVDAVERSLNVCLGISDASTLREQAGKLKDMLDGIKDNCATNFARLVEMNKKEQLAGNTFAEVVAEGFATRIKIDSKNVHHERVLEHLSAYLEFELNRLTHATKDAAYRPDKNDILDVEQLVYLGDPNLHFVTCDGGYPARVQKSPQAARIHRVPADDVRDPVRAESLLRKILV